METSCAGAARPRSIGRPRSDDRGMSDDVTRFTFSPSRACSRVLAQQGRVRLDADVDNDNRSDVRRRRFVLLAGTLFGAYLVWRWWRQRSVRTCVCAADGIASRSVSESDRAPPHRLTPEELDDLDDLGIKPQLTKRDAAAFLLEQMPRGGAGHCGHRCSSSPASAGSATGSCTKRLTVSLSSHVSRNSARGRSGG